MYVVGAGNVKGMQIFPCNSKGIPSLMSTGVGGQKWAKFGQRS